MMPMGEQTLRDAIAQWDRAMIGNDADDIREHMTEDWVIIGADGKMGGKDAFLALIRSGDLSHEVMTTDDLDIRLYGDTAVTVASGVSGGKYRGQAFLLNERMSCVHVYRDGRWRCALTHLSTLPSK